MGRRRKICNRISILTHSRLQVVIPYLKILNSCAIPSCLRSIRMGSSILSFPLSLFLTQRMRIRLLIIWRLTWGVIKRLCSVKDEVSIKLLFFVPTNIRLWRRGSRIIIILTRWRALLSINSNPLSDRMHFTLVLNCLSTRLIKARNYI